MKRTRHINATLAAVEPGSIAEELGILPGFRLIELNGAVPEDVIDYRLAEAEASLTLRMQSSDGQEILFEIEKDPEEGLGLVFEYDVFDGVRRCNNDCPFCFVDQMPKGHRDTLYIRDDDYRLSFLGGHFITLSNLREADIARILRLRLSPLNVSVHATEEQIRKRILGVKRGRDLMPMIRLLTSNGIELNTQVVIWPGVNDGVHLDCTVSDLAGFFPKVATLSVVPVGLTAHRENLVPVEPFTSASARRLIDKVNGYRDELQPKLGASFVFAADEMYVIAGEPIPPVPYYDDFPQLENGVGMLRLFEEELSGLKRDRGRIRRLGPHGEGRAGGPDKVTFVTGVAATPWLKQLADWIADRFHVESSVLTVRNRLLGDSVTVAGLLCGKDIRDALHGQDPGDLVFVPSVCVDRQRRFVDDMTVEELSAELNVEINASARWPKEVYQELLRARVK